MSRRGSYRRAIQRMVRLDAVPDTCLVPCAQLSCAVLLHGRMPLLVLAHEAALKWRRRAGRQKQYEAAAHRCASPRKGRGGSRRWQRESGWKSRDRFRAMQGKWPHRAKRQRVRDACPSLCNSTQQHPRGDWKHKGRYAMQMAANQAWRARVGVVG